MTLTKDLATKSHNKHNDNNEKHKKTKRVKGMKIGDDGSLQICHVPGSFSLDCYGCLYL